MLQLTNKNGLREFYYDTDKEDYFYKDDNTRVPDELRQGLRTTVFRQSSRRRVDLETPEETRERRAKYQKLKEKVHARIAASRRSKSN